MRAHLECICLFCINCYELFTHSSCHVLQKKSSGSSEEKNKPKVIDIRDFAEISISRTETSPWLVQTASRWELPPQRWVVARWPLSVPARAPVKQWATLRNEGSFASPADATYGSSEEDEIPESLFAILLG